jgi:hypothetical protein
MNIPYDCPAEVYAVQRRGAKRPLFFRRFGSVAEALQFVVERLPPNLTSIVLETDDQRLDAAEIATLYEASEYPLPRLARAEPPLAPAA